MVRKNEKTPNGGDYSEIYFFDKDNNPVEEKEKAVKAIIRECKKNGDLVKETFANLE